MTRDTRDLHHLDETLNAELRRGRLVSAYATFYRDRTAEAGTDLQNRVRRFFEWADTFAHRVPVRSAVADGTSYSVWTIPGPHRGGREPRTRVVARRWQDAKVVEERVIQPRLQRGGRARP